MSAHLQMTVIMCALTQLVPTCVAVGLVLNLTKMDEHAQVCDVKRSYQVVNLE